MRYLARGHYGVAATLVFMTLFLPLRAHLIPPPSVPVRQGIVGSPNSGGGGTLRAVAADSATDLWAVGDGIGSALIAHSNGGGWVLSPSPTENGGELFGVAALATNNVWAVGEYSTQSPETLVEHWNGTNWSVIPSPNVGNGNLTIYNYFYGIAAISANNIWAVGTDTAQGYQTLTEHWNGTAWSIVASPNVTGANSELLSASVDPTGNVWAAGYYQDPTTFQFQTLIERWNGTSWSIVPSADVGGNSNLNKFASINAISATDIWAAGYYCVNSPSFFCQTLTEHWNGLSWSVIANPILTQNNFLTGITAVSSTNVWAVGYQSTPYDKTLLEHWDGAKWSVLYSLNVPGVDYTDLLGVTQTSTFGIWAVGYYGSYGPTNINQSLIEVYGQYFGGTGPLQPLPPRSR